MNITFENKNDLTVKTDVLIFPVFGTNRSPLFVEIDRSLNGLLKDVLRKKPSLSQKGAELVHVSGKPQKAVLLVGIGDFRKATAETLRKAGGSASGSLREYELKKVSLSVKDLVQHGLDYFSFLDGFLLNRYLFTKYKTKPEKIYDGELTVLAAGTGNDLARLKWGMNLAEAVHVARDLINSPANDITPSALAGIARGLAKGKVSVRVFGANEIRKLGMNAFYAVAKGSSEEPRLIVLNYSGRKDSPLIALVGKSVTFDSGGLSIKPSEGMEKMKYDMAGGAAVLAVMQTVSRLGLPVNVMGVIPACENLPSGSAVKPGDIVKALNGRTVEIVNTDAEGRLLLADAIAYTKKSDPRVIIDIATLTGACSVALGNEAIAMMGSNEQMMERMRKASDSSGERVWPMPLYDEFADYLKSDAADMKNTGGRTGSLIAAAYFLKEFAGETPWIHLDIASTAWNEKDRPYLPKGASGAGVRLIMEFIKEGIE